MMQVLAAYSMHALVSSAEAVTRISHFDRLTTSWLEQKGAIAPTAAEGEFKSKTGDGTGLFSRVTVLSAAGQLHELSLVETASNGDMFTTQVRLSHLGGRITVFAMLGSAPKSVSVTTAGLQPKCPAVIRSLIEAYHDWSFNEQNLPSGQPRIVGTEDETLELCDDLFWEGRSLPTVLVSSDPDGSVWPGIATELANHLVGLAEVVDIERDAAWILTDELEKPWSCYRGAVRLYWPGVRKDQRLRSQLWASDRQTMFGIDEEGVTDRHIGASP